MKKNTLYVLWGVLFSLCAVLGFIPGFSAQVPVGLRAGLMALSLVCFLPPFRLLQLAGREKDMAVVKLVRNLSALSLGLTALVLVLSVAMTMAGDGVGNFLHVVLILVSSPMMCSGYWAASLFLWACLLSWSVSLLKKEKNAR